MPTIPKSAQTGSIAPQLPQESTLLDSSKATARAFGADQSGAEALGNSVSGLGDAVEAEALRLQDEANHEEAKQLDLEYAQNVQRILNGDPDTGAVGYYGLSMKEAVDRAGEFRQLMRDARNRALDGGSTKNVTKALSNSIKERELSYSAGFSRHFSAEDKKHKIANAEARLKVAIVDGAASVYDLEAFHAEWGRVNGEALSLANHKGATSPEMKLAQLHESRSLMLTEAVNRLDADGQVEKGLELVADYGPEVPSDVRLKLLNQLKSRGEDMTVDAVLNEALAFSADPAIQLEYIKKASEGKAEERAIRRWSVLNNFARQQEADARAIKGEARRDDQARIARERADRQAKERELIESSRDTLDRFIRLGGGDAVSLRNRVLPEIKRVKNLKKRDELLKQYEDRYRIQQRAEQDGARVIKEKESERKAAREKAASSIYDKHHAAILSSGTPGKAFSAISRADRVLMTDARVKQLESLAGRISAGHQVGETPQNIAHVNKLLQMPYRQMIAYDVTQEINNLTPGQFKLFQKKHQDIASKRGDIEKAIFNASGRLSTLLGDMQLAGTLKTTHMKTMKAKVEGLFNNLIAEKYSQKGFVDLTDQELQTIEGEVKRKRDWNNPDDFTRWFNDEDTYATIVSKMSDGVREKIIADFQAANGYYPNDLEIAREAVRQNPPR